MVLLCLIAWNILCPLMKSSHQVYRKGRGLLHELIRLKYIPIAQKNLEETMSEHTPMTK